MHFTHMLIIHTLLSIGFLNFYFFYSQMFSTCCSSVFYRSQSPQIMPQYHHCINLKLQFGGLMHHFFLFFTATLYARICVKATPVLA